MERKKSHITIILMEVPEQENERRLGARGWKNETWEKYYQKELDEETKSKDSNQQEEEEVIFEEDPQEKLLKIKEQQVDALKNIQMSDEHKKILDELKEMDDEEKKSK
jgi:hypothetical protein